MYVNEVKGSTMQNDPFTLFACQTTDNCNNSYLKWFAVSFCFQKYVFFRGVISQECYCIERQTCMNL